MICLVTGLKGQHYFLNEQEMEIGIRVLFSSFHINIYASLLSLLFNYSQMILFLSSPRAMLNYQSRYFCFSAHTKNREILFYSGAQNLQNWATNSPQRIETTYVFQGHQIPEMKGKTLPPSLVSSVPSTPQTHRSIIKISLTQDSHWEVSYPPPTFNVSRNSKKIWQYLRY